MATGYSAVITKYTKIRKVIIQPFAGAEAWPSRMQSGEVNFGQHCGFKQVMEAYTGTGVFKPMGRLKNVRNVATAYGIPYSFHAVDPKIKQIADLKGRTVFVQPSHTDLYTATRTILQTAGLTLGKDVKAIPFRSPTEATQGLLTGRGDAMVYATIPGLTEVQQGKGLHTLPITDAMFQKVSAVDPIWGQTVIKAGTGPTKPAADTPVLELECGLAAGAQTSADTVYAVMQALYDHHDEWASVHPLAKQWTLKKATQINVAPYHEGAVRFYKEKGVWTAALEAKQKKLLAE
jgi:TRAP transporter TAXI family solute receptor